MSIRVSWICAVLLVAPLTTEPTAAQGTRDASAPKHVTGRGFAKLSPFRTLRRSAAGLEVQIDDDVWHQLVSIEGIATADLIRRAKEACGRKWYERIREDLVELLTVLEGKVGDTVALEVRALHDGKPGELQKLAKVKMTHDKRQRLRRMDDSDDESKRPATTLDPAFVQHDLEYLADALRERFSYFELRGVDLTAQLAGITERLGDGEIRPWSLAREVDRLLREFGDGHTRLDGAGGLSLPGFLPFLIDQSADGYVAFRADRSGLVDAEHPYVIALDGIRIEKWLETASALTTRGSQQMIARGSVRALRNLNEVRTMLGLELDDDVQVTLRGGGGEKTTQLDVADRRRPAYGKWPRTSEHARLDGDIGYLRIVEMDDDARLLDGLDRALSEFNDTAGLIIDVRGNGGGTRDALRRLFPYFMGKNESPFVANIAAYRIPPEERDRPAPDAGYLRNRALYPADWSNWTSAQRRAIKQAQKRFQPEWKPGEGFSEWHYFVLDRSENHLAYRYEQPVVILIDDGCFSATDIFVGAFKGRSGVTLLGTPTSGGSGRTRPCRLPNSGLELRISSMASYRPNGKLYDGNGIQPDLVVPRIPTDYLNGGTDSQLEAAAARLRK